MALTPLQILELNKRVDKILHAPSNAPVKGQPLEIAFVLDLSADRVYLDELLRDMVRVLKAHDRIFQNVRSNVVYCNGEQMITKVTPMSFIQMGKAMEDIDAAQTAPVSDSRLDLGALCAYLKLYHARSKCVFVLTSNTRVTGNGVMDDRSIEVRRDIMAQGYDIAREGIVTQEDALSYKGVLPETRDIREAIEGLNPFLKYRMLIITPDKMISGTEILMKLMVDKEK